MSMACCNMGSTNFGTLKAPSAITENLNSRPLYAFTLGTGQRTETLQLNQRLNRRSTVHCSASMETKFKDCSKAPKISRTPLSPSAVEVESLITKICDSSSIMEFELKCGEFELHLMRDMTAATEAQSPPPAIVVSSSNGSSSAIVKSTSTTTAIVRSSSAVACEDIPDKPTKDGLMIIMSERVGYFHKCKTMRGGKRGPPACKEKQQVKEGQVVCYITQFGCELPINTEVTGEVVKFLQEDGGPVGYGDPLLAILPSFPLMKNLQA